MHFSLEQIRILRNNKYAVNMADTLFKDVYPDIIFLMNKLGIFSLEFSFGKDEKQDTLIKNFDIEVVLSKEPSGDCLNIILKKFIFLNAMQQFGETVLKKHLEESHLFLFTPNDIRNYYFSSEGEDNVKMPSKEPFFCLFTHYNCPSDFKTTTELYLFYCENIVKLAEELRYKYCDGFLNLETRAKKISFPLERKVILEKVKV